MRGSQDRFPSWSPSRCRSSTPLNRPYPRATGPPGSRACSPAHAKLRGVSEYWFVDPDHDVIRVYRRASESSSRLLAANVVLESATYCWLCIDMASSTPVASRDIQGTKGSGSPAMARRAGPTVTVTASSLRTALPPLNTPLVGGTSA